MQLQAQKVRGLVTKVGTEEQKEDMMAKVEARIADNKEKREKAKAEAKEEKTKEEAKGEKVKPEAKKAKNNKKK